ncbi:hypothetical protein P12x_006158 (plasmid) [Tundrisphaera lichenicola]|uniref:hypothetical protein n=1 Tax=Tundrisphaera lichenicola TaxID=2029860 RepID=UPI003EBABEC0
MITLTRRQARDLRGIFRRSVLGIAHRGPIPPIVFSVESGRLRVRHHHAHLAVEHAAASAWPSGGSVALPLEALAEFEGRDEATVALDPASPERTVARWSDRGIPQFREYPALASDGLGPFPESPRSWVEAPACLLDALAEATATAAEVDTRYALSSLALRGSAGSIAATDGHQILIQGGFEFPWDGDVLVGRSPLFACRDLPRDRPISIAKTDSHVALRVGPWTIWLEVLTDLRYPDVDRILPGSNDALTRWQIDPGDARFLLDSLGRLPGAEETNAPATIDLNGRIAVRAKAVGDGHATELVLSRSVYTGPPVRLQTNREFLGRAIRLGFSEVEVVDAESPLVCRDQRRVLAWQPLSGESALGPSEDVVRIESPPAIVVVPEVANDRIPLPRQTDKVEPAQDRDGTGLPALIREAESIHRALGEARSRSQKLVVALRRQRKQARLVAATLDSLRQLRLREVAG